MVMANAQQDRDQHQADDQSVEEDGEGDQQQHEVDPTSSRTPAECARPGMHVGAEPRTGAAARRWPRPWTPPARLEG